METKIPGPNGFHFEYRFNEDGSLDELLLMHKDQCLVHLEQMSEKGWYCGLHLPGDVPNQNGIIPASRSVQLWFQNLAASDDDGDILINDGPAEEADASS